MSPPDTLRVKDDLAKHRWCTQSDGLRLLAPPRFPGLMPTADTFCPFRRAVINDLKQTYDVSAYSTGAAMDAAMETPVTAVGLKAGAVRFAPVPEDTPAEADQPGRTHQEIVQDVLLFVNPAVSGLVLLAGTGFIAAVHYLLSASPLTFLSGQQHQAVAAISARVAPAAAAGGSSRCNSVFALVPQAGPTAQPALLHSRHPASCPPAPLCPATAAAASYLLLLDLAYNFVRSLVSRRAASAEGGAGGWVDSATARAVQERLVQAVDVACRAHDTFLSARSPVLSLKVAAALWALAMAGSYLRWVAQGHVIHQPATWLCVLCVVSLLVPQLGQVRTKGSCLDKQLAA